MLMDGPRYGQTYGCTDVGTDGKPDPYMAPCLRQARQKIKITNEVFLKILVTKLKMKIPN